MFAGFLIFELSAQVYSWERTKIMEEIAILELKQKRLITMLSQIDPVIYLQKLQQELSALQVPRTLKLILDPTLFLT